MTGRSLTKQEATVKSSSKESVPGRVAVIEVAREAYLSNYEQGWTSLGAITQVSKDEFKKWIQSSRRKTKPFAEYNSPISITTH